MPLFPTNSFTEQFSGVGEVKFVLDAGAVGLDGLDANVEFLGDLSGLPALAEALKHLEFAVAE